MITFTAAITAQECRLTAQEATRIEVRIIADDMCCPGCAQKVAAQLYAAPGVTNVVADVPKRIVKVTAMPSPKLTLERLWRAVEKGKGAPSQLITAQATYALTRVEQLPPSERQASGQYVVELAELPDAVEVEKMTSQLQSMPGVRHVTLEESPPVLTIQSASDVPLSEWALVRIVKNSGLVPVRVAGPFGSLAIEYAESRGRTAANPSNRSMRGGVR
jgi:copper chaperone CopZ